MMRTHYVQELESVRQNLVRMGETTLSLLAEALSAITDRTPGSFLEEKETSLTWHYRFTHPDFGSYRAKELQAHMGMYSFLFAKGLLRNCELFSIGFY